MSYFFYIIQSQSDNSHYSGSCKDVHLRLQRHNEGWSRSTKGLRPWKLVLSKEFATKSEALKFERYVKRMKSREFIDKLIKNAGGRPDP